MIPLRGLCGQPLLCLLFAQTSHEGSLPRFEEILIAEGFREYEHNVGRVQYRVKCPCIYKSICSALWLDCLLDPRTSPLSFLKIGLYLKGVAAASNRAAHKDGVANCVIMHSVQIWVQGLFLDVFSQLTIFAQMLDPAQ